VEPSREFRISLDTANTIMTAVVVAIIVGVAVVQMAVLLWLLGGDLVVGMINVAIGVGIIAILPVTYLYAPQKYVVTQTEIVVSRHGPNVIIPLTSVTSVEPVGLKGVIRTCGAGGFFGSWGWFYCRALGSFRAYVTRGDRTVLVRLAGKKPVVLSPDAPEGFIQAVQAQIAATG